MQKKHALMLPLIAGSLSLAAVSAQARMTPDQVDALLKQTGEYGFTHYEEISFDDGEVEVEGWLDNDWTADVDFTLQGEAVREERRRRDGGARGLSADDVRNAVKAATAEGLTQIEEIQTRRGNTIEVEGYGQNGGELEIHIDVDSYQVINIDRD
ncbi:hypothetical protein A167_01557 [Alcanivorax sp. S71-1-4]|uniref:PepSY domain-containing protein n=1 Tax=Alcanivorax sp. S71-1-4 TaxID=1177159 RepID=UPI0016962E56|nr:PepSY domain-containing protein [Alcanivorax sp. S71-1-4]KAF0809741.1 hypothetical protein A167_01557 [Alcanivorax sp. S71-1-4]